MSSAFISHSSRNDGYAAELESFIRSLGYNEVFNDVHSIKPDMRFWPEIEEGIRKCDVFIVVITSASMNSEWVQNEIAFADKEKKSVIPVWVEDCELPARFEGRDVLDFRPKNRERSKITDTSHFEVIKYAPEELIGREPETKLLNNAWKQMSNSEKNRPRILTFVALGGEGKTSLVAKWAADLAHQDWIGCDAVFTWSFYSQGTHEQMSASSDIFLNKALIFFGNDDDKEFADSNALAHEKGKRLARIIGQRRGLLILDGLEPLQYAPSSPTPGELKDHGLIALFTGLASNSLGLCVITTRYSIPNLRVYRKTTAPEHELKRLSKDAGVLLLRSLGIQGAKSELEELVEDVEGHALTLSIFGGYLKRVFHGDIRKRDMVKFDKANEKIQNGHAFRAIAAYEKWLMEGSDEGRREVAILRLTGLFDRPADAGAIAALRSESIPGLTDLIVGLNEEGWEFSLSGLESAKLLNVNRDTAGTLISLDAHPLIREYFAAQLKEKQPEAWRAAHSRLFDYLCGSVEHRPDTLAGLQPLYQAVSHGCLAGLHQEACDKVYFDRILRGTGDDRFYSSKKLGAIGANLGAVAAFFDEPWKRLSPNLRTPDQAWLLNEAAFYLRALGRLNDAVEPMCEGMNRRVKVYDWENASNSATNLSELEVTLGYISKAVEDGRHSIEFAKRSGNAFWRMCSRVTTADALHQSGETTEAMTLFTDAERMQEEMQPELPMLYSLRGFRYTELILAPAERAAWHLFGVHLSFGNNSEAFRETPEGGATNQAAIASCDEAERRAKKVFEWRSGSIWNPSADYLLNIALDHLTLARAALYHFLLEVQSGSEIEKRKSKIYNLCETALSKLRMANDFGYLPKALLTAAFCAVAIAGKPEEAIRYLDEAEEIAERGPMPLYLADIRLHRTRLFGKLMRDNGNKYPWESPQSDLKEARRLIEKHGYGRRKEELEDAEAIFFKDAPKH